MFAESSIRLALPVVLAISAVACGLVSGADEFAIVGAAGSSTGGATSGAGAGGTGAGGAIGVGGVGGVGGGTAELSDDDLVVRYFLDEAASGTAPTEVFDASPNPFNLLADYGGNSEYTVVDGNGGLRWFDFYGYGGPWANIDQTKVMSSLQGATAATIEVVASVEAAAVENSRLVHIGTGDQSGALALYTDAPDTFTLRLNQLRAGVFDIPWRPRQVLHLVFDSTRQNESDRVRMFADGEPQVVAGIPGIAQNAAVGLTSSDELVIGNRPTGLRSIQGAIFYAALYAAPFDEARAQRHALALAASDDSPQ